MLTQKKKKKKNCSSNRLHKQAVSSEICLQWSFSGLPLCYTQENGETNIAALYVHSFEGI